MITSRNGLLAWTWFVAVVVLSSPGLYFGLIEWFQVAFRIDVGAGLIGQLYFYGAMAGPFASALAIVPLLALLFTRRARLSLKLTSVVLVGSSIFFLIHFKVYELLG